MELGTGYHTDNAVSLFRSKGYYCNAVVNNRGLDMRKFLFSGILTVLAACARPGSNLPTSIDGPIGSMDSWTFDRNDGNLILVLKLDSSLVMNNSKYSFMFNVTKVESGNVYIHCTGTIVPGGVASQGGYYGLKLTASPDTLYSIIDDLNGNKIGQVDTHFASSSI